MNEWCFLSLYLILEFIVYILFYKAVFDISITKNKIKMFFVVIVIFCIHYGICFYKNLESAKELSFLTMLSIPLFLMDSPKKPMLLVYPFIALGTSVVGIGASFFIAIICNVPEGNVLDHQGWYLLCQSIMPIVCLIFIILKHRKEKLLKLFIDRKTYIFFYIIVFCMFFMIAPLQFLSKRLENYWKLINWVGAAACAGGVILVGTVIWRNFIWQKTLALQKQNIANENYIKYQTKYYDCMLAQDDKIRRFRHDMREHFSIMKMYCEDHEYDKLNMYIDQCMSAAFLSNRAELTGVRVVDVILFDLLAKAKEKDIRCEIKGKPGTVDRIEDYDLCTIFYNIVQNAVEACEKIPVKNLRKIEIAVGEYQSLFYISVKNTVLEPVCIVENKLFTTKDDAKNHGIGSLNVARTVEKYDGFLQYSCDDQWFTVEICL